MNKHQHHDMDMQVHAHKTVRCTPLHPNFNGGLVKPPSKFWYGCVIASNKKIMRVITYPCPNFSYSISFKGSWNGSLLVLEGLTEAAVIFSKQDVICSKQFKCGIMVSLKAVDAKLSAKHVSRDKRRRWKCVLSFKQLFTIYKNHETCSRRKNDTSHMDCQQL